MGLPLLLLLLLVLLQAGSSEQNRLYWHRSGLQSPVLVRSLHGRVSIDPVMRVNLLDAAWLTQTHFDPIAKQAYVKVPVLLRDDEALFVLRNEKSIQFATVTDVKASVDAGSIYEALGFVWSQGEPVGYLRLGCNGTADQDSGHTCKIEDLVQRLRSRQFATLRRVLLTARVRLSNGRPVDLDYRLRLQDSSQTELDDYSVSSRTDSIGGEGMLPDCRQAGWLKPWKAVRISNDTCSAMVYSYRGGEFSDKSESGVQYLVEEPICFAGRLAHSILIQGDLSDVNRWNLTLRMLKPDSEGRLLAEIASRLSKSVDAFSWMRLWRARRSVSSAIASRIRVGQLRMPAEGGGGVDRGSGEVEVHCKHEAACRYLAAKIASNPVNFWRHIRWQPTYLAELPLTEPADKSMAKKPDIVNSEQPTQQCFHSPDGPRFVATSAAAALEHPGAAEATAWSRVCGEGRSQVCRIEFDDGRQFVVVQQHQSASERFDRPWTDYVKGFGDGSNFWIGLTAMHLLTTANHREGATLRIRMTFWNGTERVAEYSGFKVAGPEANFSMTYDWMVPEKSNVPFDSLAEGKGVGFSTYDRDHDRDPGSCSQTWGRGGWWFGACYRFYPNGWFPALREQNTDWRYMKWLSLTEIVSLNKVRMMVQL